MGQKVHPIGMRLGINRTWKSRWFAKKNYAELLKEDLTIRKYVTTKLARAGISDVIIERKADKVVVNVRTARPGIVIGRKGIEVERLNKELEHLTSRDIRINILEVKRVELDAQLVAEHIAKQLESRMGFRRAVRKAVESTMRMGAKGIKVRCAGRLGGAEMARVQEHHEGRVPLHTLRADIDFAKATAKTTHGTVGVKVWIFKGEKLSGMVDDLEEESRSDRDSRGRRDDRSGRGRGDRPPNRGGRGSGGRGAAGGRSGGRSSGGRGGSSGGRSGSGRPSGGGRPASGGSRPSGGGKPASGGS
ncbi:MAG: 30S ribosomal protein S3, partial [Deltaproteobacteria bacterium]|nr:30S ribosomal protein S3 [Deltaproteobacteria bacterium]